MLIKCVRFIWMAKYCLLPHKRLLKKWKSRQNFLVLIDFVYKWVKYQVATVDVRKSEYPSLGRYEFSILLLSLWCICKVSIDYNNGDLITILRIIVFNLKKDRVMIWSQVVSFIPRSKRSRSPPLLLHPQLWNLKAPPRHAPWEKWE